MINYLYDGSFEGLLTCIYEAYYRHESPYHIYLTDYVQQSLIDTNTQITTDADKASKVYESIYKKISYQSLRNIYHAYLSESEDIEINILNYIRLGFKMGRQVDLHLSDDRVLTVHAAAKRVIGESHLMLGLLRFKQLRDDVFYAQYTPNHNITMLIAPHFVNRFPNQNWLIQDLKRHYAAVFDKHQCIFTNIADEITLSASASDTYETLWKNYFKSICINERVNSKLQKRNMPSRYWKHLTEKQL